MAGTKLPNVRKASTRWTRKSTPIRTSPPTTTTTSSARIRDEPAQYAKNFKTVALDGQRGRRLRQAAQVQPGRDPGAGAAGRARLPASLRGSLVDRGAVGRLLPQRAAQQGRAHLESASYVAFETFCDRRQMPHAGGTAVPLRRRPAHGRSHASAGAICVRACSARRCRRRTARRCA